jgi:hypothetical protein
MTAVLRFDPRGVVDSQPVGDFYALREPLRTPAASRAGLAVAGEPAAPGDTPQTLTKRALARLDADAVVIDVEDAELAGVPAVRLLFLEQLGGVATVVLEQWRFVAAGTAWVVTATADLASWARIAAALRDVVATMEVAP